ncbi:unnamed protein product [Symbiodinium natans]|uniref:EF-hand domain-containing protein n=1 Tax=Symbiodinium natans TaxID=878477 RepID=A0A812KVI3_9DINO|nr:unnamed protein product [Symbiodinium natans]
MESIQRAVVLLDSGHAHSGCERAAAFPPRQTSIATTSLKKNYVETYLHILTYSILLFIAGTCAGDQSGCSLGNAEEGRKSAAKRKEEDAARKKELEQKQKEEAAKQKKDLEEKRRQEQRSTLAIRRVIQKIRLASPETFDEVQKELQEILRVELENTGSQKERIKEESEKGLEQARKRLDSIKEQRQKELDKKTAEEKKRLEQQAKTDELLKELSALVETAETGVTRLKELAAPLSDKIEDSVKEVEACALAVEEAGSDAKTATKACTDFILVNGNDIKDSAPVLAIPGIQATGETKQALGKLLQRINECGKTAESLIQAARGAKEQAVRRAFARQKTKEMEAMFAKYDKDKDNVLSQVEVVAYAKKEMSVNVDKALLEKVWKCTVDADEKGVVFEKMSLLNASIGIAREMQRNERRKAARIAKERVLAGLREKVRAKVREAERFAMEFEKELRATEKVVAPLFAKAKTSPFLEMEEDADHCDSLVKACRATEEKMLQRVKSIPLGFDKKYEDDLREFVKIETKPLESRMGRADLRLARAANLSRRHREQGWRRRAQEMEVIRSFAMKVARQFARLNKLTYEELFGHVDSDGDGALDEEEFISFFSAIDKDVKEEEFEPEEVVAEEEPEKPVQVNALEEADNDGVEDTNVTNSINVGTALDQAPLLQEAASRLQAIAAIMLQATPKPKPKPKPVAKAELTSEELKSLFRNLLEPHEVKISREVFLRIVKVYYKVVKETPMTEKLEVNGSQTVHQLKVGEILEMLEGPEKETSLKVFRARGKVVGDENDKEGWVTIAGNQGTIFLQEGGHLWKVLRQSELSETFEDTQPKAGVRKVKEGEVLEVLTWPKKDEESGLKRLRVRAKMDGAIGWITQINKDGTVLADPI